MESALYQQYNLEPGQIEKLHHFEEVTNSQDHEFNICTLASLEWNLERAIENHLLGESVDQGGPIPMEQDNDDIQIIGSHRPAFSELFSAHNIVEPAVRSIPRRLPATSNEPGALNHHASSSSSVANGGVSVDDDEIIGISDEDFTIDNDDIDNSSGNNGAPLVPTEVDCVMEANHNFVTVFRARYVESLNQVMPSFFHGALNDAVREAFEAPNRPIEERRPLALYVHSDKSVCANIFASTVLCKSEVASLLKHQYILWPWDITYNENEVKLKEWLNHCGMPEIRNSLDFACRMDNKLPVIFLIIREKGTLNIVDTCYGSDSVEVVMGKLMAGIDAYTDIRLTEASEHRDRMEREQIRAEQAEEYNRSLAADKARMEAKLKEMEEQRLEEERKRQEAEQEELHRAKLASELPDEPEESEVGAIVVKFRLPNDEQCVRRFRKAESLSVLLKFLGARGYDNKGFRFMNSDFPKKDVASWDGSKTFEELKWPVREQIFVEEV